MFKKQNWLRSGVNNPARSSRATLRGRARQVLQLWVLGCTFCLSCAETDKADVGSPADADEESLSSPADADYESVGLPPDAVVDGDSDRAVASVSQPISGVQPCNQEQLARLTEKTSVPYVLTCSADLAGKTIYRPLSFYGDASDGVTLDCQGGTIGHLGYNDGSTVLSSTVSTRMIAVRSKITTTNGVLAKNSNGYYVRERPESIVIRNCKIYGTVRIWGLGENGQKPYVKQSSIDNASPGHPARARDAAPSAITLDNVTIHGEGGNPLYLAPGVTGFTLVDSTLEGTSTSVGLYMDAESRSNVIRNNFFTVNTDNREIIAMDGSSDNLIVNNRFVHLEEGGIFLYRNCGEGGSVRWTGPSYNRIVNNYFYYNLYNGSNPAIYVGSRDGSSPGGYCDEDAAYPWGSGANDYDFARYNTIMQNQIRKRSVSDAIVLNHPSINSSNEISLNQTVSERIDRKAGCRPPSGGFLNHDASADIGCTRYFCNDGVLVSANLCSFSYSSAGPIAGKYCVQLSEPADPHTWEDNYLCSDEDLGLRWSYAGAITGMSCVKFDEAADPHGWDDNYLCSPRNLGFVFARSGPISGKPCVAITEPVDPYTWDDNYLCWTTP